MQDIINLDRVWHYLNWGDLLPFSETDSFARSNAKEKRTFEIFIIAIGKTLTPYLNTSDYSRLRMTCKLAYQRVPEHNVIVCVKQNIHDFGDRQRELYNFESCLALKSENCFAISQHYELPLELGSNSIVEKFRTSQDSSKAIAGIKFFIPAGQTLSATITIRGLSTFCVYELSAADRDRVLEDPLFNRPLPINEECGIWSDDLIVQTNCPAVMKIASFELLSRLIFGHWVEDQEPIYYFGILMISQYRTNLNPLLRVIDGMVAWTFTNIPTGQPIIPF